MIYLEWLALTLLDWALLLTVPFAAPIIAAFTGPQPYGKRPYTWGGWWGTWDNPPQGDEGYVAERCPFPMQISGLRGYVNRVMWMIRNPLYGYARYAALDYSPDLIVTFKGDASISDKEKRPGWYFATARRDVRIVGFELYAVLPWSSSRNLRMRLGWKMMTDKFKRYGFAQLVNTFNPLDGYGEK